MDDAEYIFRTDAKEKKIIARSARRKVTHSGCKLPSDYLTAKQKKQLNGEVMTVNMNKPMSYDEFKKIPIDLQAEYLSGLVLKYNAMATNIGEMMGTNGTVLARYCKRHPELSHIFTRHPKPTTFDKDGFEKFCNGEAETDEKPAEETNTTIPEEAYEQKQDRVKKLLESEAITVDEAADMLGIEFKPGAGWDVEKLNQEKLEDARQQVAELEDKLGQAIDYSKKPNGKIVTYCENDVRSTQELYRAFRGADIITFSVELRDVRDLEDILKYLKIIKWPEKNSVYMRISERSE